MPRNRLVKLHRQEDGEEITVNFDLIIMIEPDPKGTSGTRLTLAPGDITSAYRTVTEPPDVVYDLAEKA